jgi:hypothetical protein
MAPEETGRGVLAAAQGRHFAAATPAGDAAQPDLPIDGLDPHLITVPTVPIRTPAGTPRPLAEIDREVAALVEQAIAAGRRCLLHVLAGSKTGLCAPSFEAVQRLHERFGARLDVVVDACQMRLPPERVRACLEAGWMVLLTGSKFFGGPAFAGALLVPAGVAARAPELAPLPPGLAGYFTRPEWPGAWQRIAADLPERANLGLVLRWQAALWEMRAFAAVPAEQRQRIIAELGAAIRAAIEASRWLRPVAVASAKDCPQTIFPFEVLRAEDDGGGPPMDLAAVQHVHRWLNADIAKSLPPGTLCSARSLAAFPCHLGQPVAIGKSALLRICIGAHLVWETACDEGLGSSFEARLEAQIQRARLVVRKTELIPQYYDALCAAAEDGAQARSA